MSLFIHEDQIRPEWIDYNGHMQDAYYALIFSQAVTGLEIASGADAQYRADSGCTFYVIEGHIWWLREAHEGAPIRVETRLLDLDAKRMHLWQEMTHIETGARLSVNEVMALHVSQRSDPPRAAPMPDAMLARLEARFAAHRALGPVEPRAGAIGLRRKS